MLLFFTFLWSVASAVRTKLHIAGCDIVVQSLSVCPCARPCVRPYVNQSVNNHILVFTAPVKAGSVKPCIVILLDLAFKHTSWHDALDLYSTVHRLCIFTPKLSFLCSWDSVNVKHCIVTVIVLDIPFKHGHWPCGHCLYFKVHYLSKLFT